MARGNPTGFPLTQNEFEGGRGLTKGSTAGETLSLMELLHNLETWIKLRGVVSTPSDLPAAGMLDGDMYVVWESAGVGSPPALYIYNIDTTTWVNVTSTGIPANHASTHYNGAADPLLDAVTTYAVSSPVAAADKTVVGTGGAPGITLTLPTAVGIRGRSYLIFKGDAAAGAITVAAQGGQAINGAASLTLPNQYDSILVESDNVGWVAVRPAQRFHAAEHLNGGTDPAVRAPTVPGAYPYVILATDEVVLGTAGGAPVVTTLPTAVGISGRRYMVVKIDAGIGAVAVTPAGAETINGAGAAYNLLNQWDSVVLESNGVGWNVLSAFPAGIHAGTHRPGATDELFASVRGIAATGPVLATDGLLLATGGGAGIVLTLPTAVGIQGRRYIVKKIDAAVGVVTVNPQAGEVLEGGGVGVGVVVPEQWDTLEVVSDGAGWVIVPRTTPARHAASHEPGGLDEMIVPPTVPGAYPYVLQVRDEVVLASSGGAPVAIALHTAVGYGGKRYVFKKIDAPAFAVNVTPAGAEVIENLAPAAPYALAAQWDTVTLESNGVGWNVINAHPVPAAHALLHRPAGVDELLDPITSPPAGAYVVLATDKDVRMDSGGAGVACTLYAAGVGAVGRTISITKVDVAGFAIAVTPNGAELINGVNVPVALAAQWNSVTLKCVAVGQWETRAVLP